MRRYLALLGLIAASLLATGCATSPGYDYSAYRADPPRSILVLPPINNSVEVNAPYVYLSTVTRPLAEAGYYVYPVAVVDAFMKENGLSEPAEMQSVPLNKIDEVIGPDAVLYATIEDWGQKFHVLSSDTTVDVSLRLIDTQTGTLLWDGKARAIEGSNNNQGGLLAAVIVAVVEQIVDTSADRTREVSRMANVNMVADQSDGLPLGPYNPEHVTDPRRQ
ncbi:hypothetical protein C84B14_00170 [Salinisphaera sp. C84B14]|jgi:hypothetical protein|uniref:DUF799 domain-containing protein n=1 Tax=Salinisphaera sp. C84B14 TaxID=1304155 RepID=UPI0032B12979